MSVRPIILAEDNDKLRRMYADMLESAGFKVMTASDGEKCIGLLHKIVHPLIMLLDVMMPRLDGIETCRRVRRMQGLHPCPILFLTALDNPETILECLRAGGDDYLVKTAPLAEVLDRVQYWSRKGSSDEGQERRNKAIKELEALASESVDDGAAKAIEEISSEQSTINEIADFISNNSEFGDDHPLLYRFGYVVGLVNACLKDDGKGSGRFSRLMRNLVFRTDIIDRKEIDALLDNYERIVVQAQFQQGWIRGRDDSPKVGMPAVDKLSARLAESEIN